MSRSEAQVFFERYRDAFNRGDGDAAADLWHTPSSISHPAKATGVVANTAWADDASMRNNHRALCDIYAQRGQHAWSFEVKDHIALGADQCFANLRWRCEAPGRQLLADFHTGYLLIRAETGVRVAHVAQYQERSEAAHHS
jgi:hypothetical protein